MCAGSFEKPPKKPAALAKYKEDKVGGDGGGGQQGAGLMLPLKGNNSLLPLHWQEVTISINKFNESNAAGKAEQAGGKLKTVRCFWYQRITRHAAAEPVWLAR